MDKATFIGRIYLEVEYKHGIGRLIKALRNIDKEDINDITRDDIVKQGNCGVMTWMLLNDMKQLFIK
jgi:hypothetical protein